MEAAEIRTPVGVPPAPVTVPYAAPPVRYRIAVPGPPTWSQRMIPRTVRRALAELGMWTEARPLKPSAHLEQLAMTLRHYGWAQAVDFTPSGRMCMRGGMAFLESAGHVTPADRERAVNYLQMALSWTGVDTHFWSWNDRDDTTLKAVEAVISTAASMARNNGE